MAALHEFDAVIEVMGWDEAFLAVETDDPEAAARQIADRVRARTRLDCTVGIGRNKLQAKLATGFGKPAGIFRLTDDNWFEVLGDLPTGVLWGIGAKTAARLAKLDIATCASSRRPTRASWPRSSARPPGHGWCRSRAAWIPRRSMTRRTWPGPGAGRLPSSRICRTGRKCAMRSRGWPGSWRPMYPVTSGRWSAWW
jgi:hypothetical protein